MFSFSRRGRPVSCEAAKFSDRYWAVRSVLHNISLPLRHSEEPGTY